MAEHLIEFNSFHDVIYCKAEGNYTKIILEKKCILTTKVLRCFEDMLPSDQFLRIHKSYLVNIKYISGLTAGNMIKLKTNEELPVARRRRATILKNLSRNFIVFRCI